ncbi:hypothetical protein RIF29_31516 [Crotalaria pallida]|uniref:non-specific serine/threonine protein kinase n=1 Tax=Crotalaria pallida TaxID=3830 RepID=A0AAN9EI02_CROPI
MRGVVLFLFLVCARLLCHSQPCLASDTLKAGEQIKGSETNLVSASNKFELGFFSKTTGRYLGIWYHRLPEYSTAPTVVWVANRDNPVAEDSVGVLQISKDGNLQVVDTSGTSYWSSKLEEHSSSINMTALKLKLMDSGNLLSLDEHLGLNLWQSFDHPTDTFLPGMDMRYGLELTSWRYFDDPGSGNFTFKFSLRMGNRYVIFNQSELYWESDRQGVITSLGARTNDNDVSTEASFLLSNRIVRNGTLISYENIRVMINSTGVVQLLSRDDFQVDSIKWLQPKTLCFVYNTCGKFATCNDDNNNNVKVCKCLPGFDKVNKGCARKSATCGSDTTFLNLVMTKVGNPDKQVAAANESDCRSTCLRNCSQCQAYSYATPITTPIRPHHFISPSCWIWTQDLATLKEDSANGRNLSVRVHKSDIAPTPKTCEPCGSNIVPYPLSTGPTCGDPKYFNFSCDNSKGELSFTTTTHSYRVTSINAGSRRFSIQVFQEVSFRSDCDESTQKDENLQVSSPFDKIDNNQCYGDEVEISWRKPSEPTCTESIDCKGWAHSTCKATGEGNRCLCDANYYWHGDILNCTQEAISSPNSTLGKGKSKIKWSLVLGITLTGVVIVACIIIVAYVCRRKIALKQDRESILTNRRVRFNDSERHVKDLIDMEGLEETDNEGIEVPYFDFESILVATDHFSDANKLGRGGYGPVYKGKLQGGQDIAVKRLSSVSSQGLQEFKNEVVLIAKLQHRNLVRLRGYCIKGDEKILLYEYMPNKSLDAFIFDPTQSVLLDWPMRFDIILGVARGLLYLHQDSKLRVIHRDMKTSNILLDEEMQPKISDFGLAKIFGGKETEGNTERVVGTYGYMSPEYALDGVFSTKSDVFSFGVVLLEIISGKKNTGFYQSKEVSSLLGYAWRLWTEDKLLDLMDMGLHETCKSNQFIRCALIGLLCVQDEPGDRPSMSNVVIMLDSEIATLPTPKQPTFFSRKELSSTASSSTKPGKNLDFESSTLEGR